MLSNQKIKTSALEQGPDTNGVPETPMSEVTTTQGPSPRGPCPGVRAIPGTRRKDFRGFHKYTQGHPHVLRGSPGTMYPLPEKYQPRGSSRLNIILEKMEILRSAGVPTRVLSHSGRELRS